MPRPPAPTGATGCPGCASARCVGKPGEDLYIDDYDPDKKAYCESCWAAPDEATQVTDAGVDYRAPSIGVAGMSEELHDRISKVFPLDPPLLHPGVELYATLEAGGSEVLVGKVCLALADSHEKKRVGSYFVQAFPEEPGENDGLKLPIGPHTRLDTEKDDGEEEEEEDANVGDETGRVSKRCPFRLNSGNESWLLIFADAATAQVFARDLLVRCRVMKLSSMVSRLTTENERLKQDLQRKAEDLKRASSRRACQWAVALVPAVLAVGAGVVLGPAALAQ